MLPIQTIHVVCASAPKGEDLLGYIVAGSADNALLEGDESAMPIGAYLRTTSAAIDADGTAYPMGDARTAVPLTPWSVAKYHSDAAERDSFLASAPKATRDAVTKDPNWEPEATLIAKRTADAQAKRAADEAARKR